MNKFWEWFEKKTGFMFLEWLARNNKNWKANLIGHLEEFLIYEKIFVGTGSKTFLNVSKGKSFIDIRYDELCEAIDKFV